MHLFVSIAHTECATDTTTTNPATNLRRALDDGVYLCSGSLKHTICTSTVCQQSSVFWGFVSEVPGVDEKTFRLGESKPT